MTYFIYFMQMGYIGIITELSITAFIVHFLNLITLIMDNSVILSIILIALLGLKLIFDEFNDNSIMKFLARKSIFFIMPLLIIFIGIVVYRAMNFLGY